MRISEKFKNLIVDFLSRLGQRHKIFHLTLVLIFILPIVALALFSYIRVNKSLTDFALSRRESVAYLSTIVLKEKFDRLIDIGISLATRVKFRQLISEGKWDEAAEILKSIPGDFPFIDRILLTDPNGIGMVVIPESPSGVGEDFTSRDWYQGVSKNWEPYVSNVFKRLVKPQINIIAVAIPIKGESSTEEEKMLGILVLHIRLDTLFEWSKAIEVGPSGFVYFVDRKGQVAVHPKFLLQEEIVDFSSVPAVQKALQGEQGIEVLYNPVEREERITAYRQVPFYGWAVIVQQPTRTAFADRDKELRFILIIYGLILLLNGFLIYLFIQILHTINNYRQREKIFLSSIGDGVFAIDRESNIIHFNRRAEEISGYKSFEVLAKPYYDFLKFVKEKDKSENIEFIRTALRGEAAEMADQKVLIRKDKKELAVEDVATPIKDERGEILGAIVVFRDASQKREIEKMRAELISLTGHQLKTPLTSLKGYLEMLKEKKLEGEAREYVAEIERGVKAMIELVGDVLNISKIEQGRIEIKSEPLQFEEMIESLIKDLSPLAKKRQVKIEFEKPKIALPQINVDPKYWREAIQNIISNALNYTKDKVVISLLQKDKEIYFSCRDNGIGIPQEEQSKIFTKFFRASNVAKTGVEGTGLGLSITKAIIEKSGGRIWFSSKENQGTTFYVALPLE